VSEIMKAELPREYFGGVFASNFLEHLLSQEAVAEFLERMYECLIPGGRIAVMDRTFRHCATRVFRFCRSQCHPD